MSTETIIDAIGLLDEELILGCDRIRKNNISIKLHYGKWIAAAACIFVAITMGLIFMEEPSVRPDIKLSGNAWRHFTNPITYTKPPEKELVAVTTVAPTTEPIVTAPPTPESIEATPTPTKTATDWEQQWPMFLAMMEPEHGEGIELPGRRNTSGEATSSNQSVTYSDEFFIENSSWRFELTYNEGTYIAGKSSLTYANINQYLGEVEVNIYETRLSDLHYTDTLAIYSINNISPNAGVAVQISSDEYYLFKNSNYNFSGFAGFFNDYNLSQTTTMTNMGFLNHEGSDYMDIQQVEDSPVIWNTLLSSEYYGDYISTTDDQYEICIALDSDFYGFYDMSIYLSDNGNVCIYFCNQSYSFNVGSDAFNQIYNLRRN